MSRRAVALLTRSLFGIGILLMAATLYLGLGRGDSGPGLTVFGEDLIWLLSLAMFVPVGALVATRHPHNPVGWILLVMGLSEVMSKFAYEYAAYSLIANPDAFPGGSAMAWLQTWIWVPELALFPFMILLFPDGRSISRWWGAVGWGPCLWMLAYFGYAAALWPHRSVYLLQEVESFGVGSLMRFETSLFALFPPVMLCLVASLVSLIVRFRRS